MTGKGSIRGDVNAILNDLVRRGVIAGFQTNFDDKTTGRVAITVVARPDINPKVTRLAVRTALQQFFPQVRVTVKAG